MGQRYLLIGLLSLLLLNPDIFSLANEKNIGHNKPLVSLKFKPDFLSQKRTLKSLEPTIKDRKIGPGLSRYISRTTTREALPGVFATAGRKHNEDKFRIILHTSGDIDIISDRIRTYGARILNKRGNMAAVEIPVGTIEEMLTDIQDINHARLPIPLFNQGDISEGVEITGAIDFHNAGYTGAGVKVAVIDSGFKDLTEARVNGDLPYTVHTYDLTGKGINTEYLHGTACAEIVHDMAPQAELYLLKVSDEVDIYRALDYCIYQHIDIISLSLSTFGSGPGDGTGYLDGLVDQARASGILVVASAGNYANGAHWEGVFTDLYDDHNVHEFISGDPESYYNAIAAFPDWDDDGTPETNEVTILMRWDDWPHANIDYDMYLFDYETGEPVDSSNAIQDGLQPPFEIIVADLEGTEDDVNYYALIVAKKDGEPEGTELELYLGGTSTFVPFYKYSTAITTSSSSIAEPADAESVLAVGAIDYIKWYTGPQEDFSSRGPTNAWAGSSARIKPDIMGPDGVTTSTYGASSFFGTSASAPHVAGAAALILSMYPDWSPDQLQSYIESNAIDMGEAGKDNIYGLGRLNVPVPVTTDSTEGGNGGGGGGGSGGGGGGGCFIATAAFGSPLEPQVKALRDIRDRFLLTNPLGKAFVTSYYRYSPPVAEFIADHERVRTLVRWGLLPLVWASLLILRSGPLEVITVFIFLVVLTAITLLLVFKKSRGKATRLGPGHVLEDNSVIYVCYSNFFNLNRGKNYWEKGGSIIAIDSHGHSKTPC
jgi:subtilisin family serine protease